MWTYWSLQEGTLRVDPNFLTDDRGGMPPVIYVDTDAPLYDDEDGSLITDKLWGIYYKPDFNFGGVQGGAKPFVVDVFRQNAYVFADSNYGYKMVGVGALVASELLGEPQPLLEPFRFSRHELGHLHPTSNSPFPWR
jgi:hypothetical protein